MRKHIYKWVIVHGHVCRKKIMSISTDLGRGPTGPGDADHLPQKHCIPHGRDWFDEHSLKNPWFFPLDLVVSCELPLPSGTQAWMFLPSTNHWSAHLLRGFPGQPCLTAGGYNPRYAMKIQYVSTICIYIVLYSYFIEYDIYIYNYIYLWNIYIQYTYLYMYIHILTMICHYKHYFPIKFCD